MTTSASCRQERALYDFNPALLLFFLLLSPNISPCPFDYLIYSFDPTAIKTPPPSRLIPLSAESKMYGAISTPIFIIVFALVNCLFFSASTSIAALPTPTTFSIQQLRHHLHPRFISKLFKKPTSAADESSTATTSSEYSLPTQRGAVAEGGEENANVWRTRTTNQCLTILI